MNKNFEPVLTGEKDFVESYSKSLIQHFKSISGFTKEPSKLLKAAAIIYVSSY